jgi:DNA topoisomerase-1
VRLRRSDPSSPGLRRIRRGRGFSFVDAAGRSLDDETRERVLGLVIPPAWREVWICPYPNGHIQAMGTDEAGRRQYLYHPQWRVARDQDKHERVRRLAGRLPKVRKAIERDIVRTGLGRDRVLAVALRMLDAGLFRTGGEEYQAENGSHGVATLLRSHVSVKQDLMTFSFPAKAGVEREASLRDPLLARAVVCLKRSKAPGERLLQYHDLNGWHEVSSADINTAFKALAGEEFTVKDLRTWAATVTAAAALSQSEGSDAGLTGGRRKSQRVALAMVAEHLGNTAAVARRSYVDPVVIDEHDLGRTIAPALKRALSSADRHRLDRGDLASIRNRAQLERAVLRLLRNAAS